MSVTAWRRGLLCADCERPIRHPTRRVPVCQCCGEPLHTACAKATPSAEGGTDDPDWLCQGCFDDGERRNGKRTTVVHFRDPFDVYIGRPSKWGNPFIIGKDGTREEVIAKYRAWILDQPDLLASLHELRGRRLGCWCKHPYKEVPCHGDVLAQLADGRADDSRLGEAIHRDTETDCEQVSDAEDDEVEEVYVVGDREYRGEEAEDLRELDRFWYWAAERRQR